MPGPDGWIGPERITTEHYDFVRLVVDAYGDAHIAAVARDGIFYLTNASGSWTRERLTRVTGDGYDGEPSIVLGEDGSLSIAFTRFDGLECRFGCDTVRSQGIFLVTNQLGSWSEAVPVIEGRNQEPSLQAAGGRLHLAYSRGEFNDRTVQYASEDAGVWTTQAVGEGGAPSLRVGRDGLARIAYVDRRSKLYYAAQADSGEFVVERVPGEWSAASPLLALADANEPIITFFNELDYDGPTYGALNVRKRGGTWSAAVDPFPGAVPDYQSVTADGVDVDGEGTLHVISWYDVSGPGVWYANDAGGVFRAWHVREPTNTIDDRPGGGSAIAVDDHGRPHVLYDVWEYDSDSPDQPDEDGLWYAIGTPTG